jgi:preprotein translocase subunit SecG
MYNFYTVHFYNFISIYTCIYKIMFIVIYFIFVNNNKKNEQNYKKKKKKKKKNFVFKTFKINCWISKIC